MDVHLYFGVEEPKGVIVPLINGEAAVFSARAPGRLTPNEDAAALLTINGDAVVLVVADGVGGSAAGERASCLAIRSLVGSLKEASPDEPSLRAAILNGIETANAAVTQLGVGAGTTMAIAEVRNGMVRPYHVGDSMILVVGQRGKTKLQTVCHSPVGYALEAGMLDEDEAMHHDQRHLVSNILGTPDMRIEVGSALALAPRDTLLLASDGLFDNLQIGEIVERIRKGPLKRVMQSLSADCRRRMQSAEQGKPCKPDDLTFVAFRRLRAAKAR